MIDTHTGDHRAPVRAPTRVLHLLPDLQIGGGQGVVLQLVAAHGDDVEPSVAFLRPPGTMAAAFRAAGADPVCLHADSRRPHLAVRRLVRLLRERHIDLVHVHSGPDRKYGQMAAALTRTPVVGHLHSPWDHRGVFVPDGAGGLRRALATVKGAGRDALERHTVRAYVAAGEQVEAFHSPVAHAPITTVPNGVGVPPLATLDDDGRRRRRAERGLPSSGPLLTCVGRLTAGKGQATLVSWLEDLPGTLVLVGDGEDRPALDAQAREARVDDRVLFLGSRDDVGAILDLSDVFVFASESEGLPLAVLEAMATATPVVAVTLPGLQEVIDHGVSGYLVPPGDRAAFVGHVRALLDDDALAVRVGAAGREVVARRFSGEVMTREVERVYRQVVDGDPSPT